MKKILHLLAILAFCSSYSQDWKMLFESEMGTYYYKPNTDETAWVKIVSNKTEYYPSKTSTQTKTVDGHKTILWKFNCRSRKLGIIKSTTYSKNGKVLESFSENEILVEMDYVNPDSIGEELLNYFCTSE
ncbi:surface-adhesin E family protein [Flavobacterium caeni]|uniref:WW domain-containing protein n=1 Tax=Flavobacterium caeni TaxID=490189 RepID=A0A1G5KIH6_9FLAO|nr:surface-adhesin E family protein [Flavobacterium caeni]SCZ00051.1 hypothetical protein SAMN02927903_03313 [Flavobacterium caeni]